MDIRIIPIEQLNAAVYNPGTLSQATQSMKSFDAA